MPFWKNLLADILFQDDQVKQKMNNAIFIVLFFHVRPCARWCESLIPKTGDYP